MSHLAETLTSLETYSNTNDNDDEHYNSPGGQSNNYERYPTPSTVNEASNDGSESSLNFSAPQNFLYENFQDSNQNCHTQDMIDATRYNYQLQQHLHYNTYQQGLNNDIVQPYSVANFDFNSTSSNNFSKSNNDDQTRVIEQNFTKEIQDIPTPEKSVQEEITKCVKTEDIPAYFMQPPDSESIAAAAVTARRNRNKRRTRIKFDKEQLALLEASFLRTHYPDVGIVDRLSDLLKINTDKISIWFQNRRARYKKEKKPSKSEEELIQQNIDNQTNPLDLYEAAQLELKGKQNDLNSSTNTLNESLKSTYSEVQSTKKNSSSRINRRSLNTENDDSDSSIVKPPEPPQFQQFTKSESQNFQQTVHPDLPPPPTNHSGFDNQNFFHPHLIEQFIKSEDQNYQPIIPPDLPPPINNPGFDNQNFFHPHLIQQNQFYQHQPQQNAYHLNNLLAASQHDQEDKKPTNRGSISSVATSESRSISPESQSSSSPEPPGNDQYFKNEPNYSENSQNYPSMQPNMIGNFMPHYSQQHFYHDEHMYRHNKQEPNNNFQHEQLYINYNQPTYYHQPNNRLPTAPPTKNSSSIFQPYADCNKSSEQEQQNQYTNQIHFNQLQNYQNYYNQ